MKVGVGATPLRKKKPYLNVKSIGSVKKGCHGDVDIEK